MGPVQTSDQVPTAPPSPLPPAWPLIPISIAVVSRVYSTLLLLDLSQPPRLMPLLTPFTSPLVAWDGQWYLHIALFGYHAAPQQAAALAGGHHDFAFYPGWPLLIRVLSLGGLLPVDLTAAIAANVVFVLAAVVIYRFFADRFGERTALGATLLLAFNPVGYVFSMAYTEPLFLLIAGLYFLNRYGRLSPIWAAVSMLVRVSGIAIAAAAAVAFLTRPADRARAFLAGALVTVVFAGWWTYIWRLTGNFTGWFEGSASWGKYEGVASIMREIRSQAPLEALWFAFIALMILGSLLLLRRHPDLAIYGLVAISLSLIGAPASSMPRHSMVAFPAFAALAQRLGPRGSTLLAVAFGLAQIVFVEFAFGAVHHPP